MAAEFLKGEPPRYAPFRERNQFSIENRFGG
jgi:hypothetical protein